MLNPNIISRAQNEELFDYDGGSECEPSKTYHCTEKRPKLYSNVGGYGKEHYAMCDNEDSCGDNVEECIQFHSALAFLPCKETFVDVFTSGKFNNGINPSGTGDAVAIIFSERELYKDRVEQFLE